VVTRDVIPDVSLSEQDHHANENPSAAAAAVAAAAAAATNSPAEVSHYRLIIDKCSRWLENERVKRGARRERHRKKREEGNSPETDSSSLDSTDESLNVLEALLQQQPPPPPPPPPQPRMNLQRRRSSGRIRRSLLFNGTAPSDTEYASDGEALVPACEEWLKTSEEIGMDEFKLEVLKLAHTLRCKGWRRVDLRRSKEVGIERISGALTNAVSPSFTLIL
jgi:choline kinase